jgi:hypothetical protein
MRVRSRWFRRGTQRPPEDIAQAAAFVAFRLAQDALARMRRAGYDLAPGEPYFAFLAEFLAFLVQVADRIAFARGDAAWRAAFTTALANRAGATLADNAADLLGLDAASVKARFVGRVNGRGDDYAHCGYDAAGPSYAFLRCAGNLVGDTLVAHERSFGASQVTDIEAPRAAAALARALDNLLAAATRERAADAGANHAGANDAGSAATSARDPV